MASATEREGRQHTSVSIANECLVRGCTKTQHERIGTAGQANCCARSALRKKATKNERHSTEKKRLRARPNSVFILERVAGSVLKPVNAVIRVCERVADASSKRR